MRLYWRINSFPELEHLPAEARRELVRQCFGWRDRCAVGCFAFLGGIAALFVVDMLENAFIIPSAFMPYVGAIAFATGASLLYGFFITGIRGRLRRELQEAAKDPPVCSDVEQLPDSDDGVIPKIEVWPIYWRISSFPELEHLPIEARRRLIKGTFPLRGWLAVGAQAVGTGGLATILLALPFTQLGFSQTMTAAMASSVFVAGTVLGYGFWLTQVRGQLRKVLRRLGRQHQLPMCLGCGYNLEGIESDTCPECGAELQELPGR